MARAHTASIVAGTARAAAIVIGLLALPYAAYVAAAWYRYGRVSADAATGSALANQFMPEYEVDERHEIDVAAPADVTFAVERELDLQQSALVQAIFAIRTLPGRLRGEQEVTFRRGILAETLDMGWGLLAEVPDREVVVGAATQPWEASPVFRPIPPDQFAAFNEPGYAKIVWTLAAEPRGSAASVARTETRVQTTDAESRERFRQYWSMLSPGILLIRQQALSLVKGEAEERYRRQRIGRAPMTTTPSGKAPIRTPELDSTGTMRQVGT